MAKTKVNFGELLDYIRDERTYADVRKAVAESGSPDTARLLQHVDRLAMIKGIDIDAAQAGAEQP